MSHLFWKCLAVIWGLCSQGGAYGAWSSGGGELVKHANNPWFLQNTRQVHYCIMIDHNHFKLPEDKIDQAINIALAYWKNEFSQSIPTGVGGVKLEIATQAFRRESCSAGTDLVFQMGYLSNEQIQKISDPTRYIALTIRTDYDEINLKGKGFIYISPESGPLKPNDSRLVDNPWEIGNLGLLVKVLIHELGHVFGMQHSTASPNIAHGFGLMSARFPEEILLKKNVSWAVNAVLPNIFYLDESKITWIDQACFPQDFPSEIVKFFAIPDGRDCMELTYQNGILRVYASKGSEGSENPENLIGSAKLSPKENWDQLYFPIQLWLPAEQKIFPMEVGGSAIYINGPWVKKREMKGIYRSNDGTIERPVFVSFPFHSPRGRIAGVMDGKIYMNVTNGW